MQASVREMGVGVGVGVLADSVPSFSVLGVTIMGPNWFCGVGMGVGVRVGVGVGVRVGVGVANKL